MANRSMDLVPQSRVAAERRGPAQGKFCKVCATVFPLHLARHVGKGIHGHDHIASPCAHEGEAFAHAGEWWEPAVILLPAAAPAAEAKAATV